LVRVPVGGGAGATIAPSGAFHGTPGVAVDAGCGYWTENGRDGVGAVMAAAK